MDAAEELRKRAAEIGPDWSDGGLFVRSAHEIERLRAEVERLQKDSVRLDWLMTRRANWWPTRESIDAEIAALAAGREQP